MFSELVAYLSYADAAAALRWLEAIGFDVVSRQDGVDGSVIHAELRRGDVVLMVASDDQDYYVAPVNGLSTGSGLYLVSDAVDELHDVALAAGGTSVFPPEDTEWGSRRARVLDPGGREWTIGSYRPGATASRITT